MPRGGQISWPGGEKSLRGGDCRTRFARAGQNNSSPLTNLSSTPLISMYAIIYVCVSVLLLPCCVMANADFLPDCKCENVDTFYIVCM